MVKEYIFWLGNTPALSAVEVLTTFKRRRMKFGELTANDNYLSVGLSDELPTDFLRSLGGIDRIGKVIEEGAGLEIEKIKAWLPTSARKINLGLSGENVGRPALTGVGNKLKKELKSEGRKVRFILPTGGGSRLNAAQVIFNQLTSQPNLELTLIKEKGRWLLAQTIAVQDIQAYERRDTARPVRDLKAGMLPPKLAQMMLNLIPDWPGPAPVIYDPFCGMGTILQEGWLMGYQMVGSDINQGMIEASQQNLAALARNFSVKLEHQPRLFKREARQPLLEKVTERYQAMVTEPYLGPPISTPLPAVQLASFYQPLKKFYLDFFTANRELVVDGGYLIVALPAVKTQGREGDTWHFFPGEQVDEIKKVGYSWQQLVPPELNDLSGSTSRQSILYARSDSVIGRELTRWQKV